MSNGDDMLQQLRSELKSDLREQLLLLRDHFDESRDQDVQTRDRMHVENREQMTRLEDYQRIANGRLSTLEEALRALRADYEAIRKRWHEFRASIQRVVDGMKRLPNGGGDSDEKPITRKELGIIIAIAIGAATMAVTVTLWILSHKT